MNPLVAPEASDRHARTALSVNVNKIALLRNTRHLGVPDVVKLSRLALEAGAQGITVHPRPDERHIRAGDVGDLAALMAQWQHAEYNIEGNPFHNLMDFVRLHRPHQCTLVPDSQDQFTSDHGWLFPADLQRLRPVVAELRALGVRPGAQQRGQIGDIAGADVAFVGPWVHRDALRAGLQGHARQLHHVRHAQLPRVAQQGNLVDVDGQRRARVAI